MVSVGAYLIAGVTTVLLIAVAVWTDRRYRQFDKLPAHFNFSGEPTYLWPRRVVAWLLPASFALVLLGIVGSFTFAPPEQLTGDPMSAVIWACVALLASQGLVSWLIERWAKAQNAG